MANRDYKVKGPDGDDLILLPPMMEEALAIPMDEAIDAACEALRLPLLGGPSGRGWSNFSLAQRCPHLWRETYKRGDGKEKTKPAAELQIGGLFHALSAYYYAFGLDGGNAFYRNRGLCAPEIAERIRGRKSKADYITLPNDAADQLLARLHRACKPVDDNSLSRPSLSILLEGQRLFDAHTNFYGDGNEDVKPLAIEWFAQHPILGYTCRYDMIVRLDENDPFVAAGLEPGSILIHEHKTSRYLNEWAREGWFLDGEILGQLLLWEPSGCERIFGPLAGLIVDIVTKEKTPKFTRVFVSKNPAALKAHEAGIRYQNAEFAWWEATGVYPRRFVSCWSFGKKCGLYEACQADAGSGVGDAATAHSTANDTVEPQEIE